MRSRGCDRSESADRDEHNALGIASFLANVADFGAI